MRRIKTIAEVHQLLGLSEPQHPLITLIRDQPLHLELPPEGLHLCSDLYQIWLKDGVRCSIGYGRSTYDFSEGTLGFVGAGQVMHVQQEVNWEEGQGWLLLFHPDLLKQSALDGRIDQYGFFHYEVNEALHVSRQELQTLTDILSHIDLELQERIDAHTQQLLATQIQLLLGYSQRCYDRQFYVRSNLNQDLVSKFRELLRAYYAQERQQKEGLPSVSYFGQAMNLSGHYLSDLLRKETGQGAMEHIHAFLIDRAKSMLLAGRPVSEVAYGLGFEYPQYFSKLFKAKTGISPSAYRVH